MDRSRADDVLREWSTVARSARRPFSAPKPRLTRPALPAGLLAGATLVVAIVFVIGFGSRSNQPVASGSSSPSPSATASASPSASGVASPTASSSATASPSATATASEVAGTPATVVASVSNCDISGNGFAPVVSGGDLFIGCGLGAPEWVLRVNLATNAVVRVYETNMPTNMSVGKAAVDGGALWVAVGSVCSAPCKGFLHTLRIDLSTGKTTLDLVDMSLVGDGFGYILARDQSGHLVKLDPATGKEMGQISFNYESAQIACGSLWGENSSDGSTTVARVDPANGNVVASFTDSDGIAGVELHPVGNECWAVVSTGSFVPPYGGTYYFDRIGSSGIDFRSPTGNLASYADSVAIFDGTFWLLTDGTNPSASVPGTITTIQRIDPTTWQPAGPIWTYTGPAPAFAAGGSLWAANAHQAGTTPTAVDRLDVPLGAIGS